MRKSRSNLSIGIAVVAGLLGVEFCNAQTSQAILRAPPARSRWRFSLRSTARGLTQHP
jgi:hypothetical protein